MHSYDLIEICRAWDRMGKAAQRQLDAVVGGASIEDQKPRAMEDALDFLRTVERVADTTPGLYLSEEMTDLIDRIRDRLDWGFGAQATPAAQPTACEVAA